MAVGLELGLEFAQIAEGLAACQGVGRRLEDHGEHAGVRVIDDYGHHPTEVLATLDVVRSYGRRRGRALPTASLLADRAFRPRVR